MVPRVPCSEPHDSEAFKSILLPDGDFPGNEAVSDAADEACIAAFGEFVGIDYFESTDIDINWYVPTAGSWSNGDREILCLVVEIDAEGQLIKSTGSLEGAAR